MEILRRCVISFLGRCLRINLGVLSRLENLQFLSDLMMAQTWDEEKKMETVRYTINIILKSEKGFGLKESTSPLFY